MNKQIDEMIEAIKKCSCVYTDCEQECSQCSNEELYDEALNHIARTFYEAGYRKASDVAREIISEIIYAEQKIHGAYIHNSLSLSEEYKTGYLKATSDFLKMLFDLKKKYESEGADDEE